MLFFLGGKVALLDVQHSVAKQSEHGSVFAVSLNANRHVTGVLRGFDQFMNIVLDNAVDEKAKTDIGMVVSVLPVWNAASTHLHQRHGALYFAPVAKHSQTLCSSAAHGGRSSQLLTINLL